MPRAPRLDYPGAVHHVIVRGIERRKIFCTDRDRRTFVERLGRLVVETGAALYAWALMPNHAHALLRTGQLPLSRLVQRWLGPYATAFNRRHRRAGHLFQNRFKNILVEEEPYLVELVRYIHLNPVRSRRPVTLDALDRYPWTGHAVLLGKRAWTAQDCDFILAHFARTAGPARAAYRRFVREGARRRQLPDLEGGGLRRSAGGWERLPKLTCGRERWAADERILGRDAFVRAVLAQANEPVARPKPADTAGLLHRLCQQAARRFAVSATEIATASLRRPVLDARAVVSQLAVTHYGLSLTATGRHLHVSKQSIARALQRAATVLTTHGCSPADFLVG
jgi:REP element-mobilizing transposase RayT